MSFAWNVAEARVHRSPTGEALLWRVAPRLLATRISGQVDLAFLQFYFSHAEREMVGGKLTVFHDWSAMTGYEPAARDRLKQWGRQHNADFVAVHYLVRAKVISMLIAVAALTLGRELHATTDREQFLTALAAAIKHR